MVDILGEAHDHPGQAHGHAGHQGCPLRTKVALLGAGSLLSPSAVAAWWRLYSYLQLSRHQGDQGSHTIVQAGWTQGETISCIE